MSLAIQMDALSSGVLKLWFFSILAAVFIGWSLRKLSTKEAENE